MPFKKDEQGAYVEDESGNPIWIEGDEERSVNYPAMYKSLSEAKKEASQRKERIRELESQLKKIEDIEDFDAFKAQAEKDRQTVASMADKDKTFDERVKAQVEAATKPLHETINTIKKENEEVNARLQRETITNAFSRSAFMNERVYPKARVAITELFQKHFSINSEGKLVATDADGNVIYGENGPAEFDEAIKSLMENFPGKELFVHGKGSEGGGAGDPGSGGNKGAPKKFTDCKTPEEERAFLNSLKA